MHIKQNKMKNLFSGLLVIIACFFITNVYAKKADKAKYANWLGPESCAECHEKSISVWKGTHHETAFKKLHRNKEAKKIAKGLKIRRIKTDETCVQCHYTRIVNGGGKLRTVAGVSCESCHGPAKDWIELHNDFGGKQVTAKTESAKHKVLRLAKAKKAGMVAPDNDYELFSQCYQCHTVQNEKLVNETTHKAGSDFELVAWNSGEVLHHGVAADKKVSYFPRNKQRTMYVLGHVLDLEYALRGLAKATAAGKYATAMTTRAQSAMKKLEEINTIVPIDEVTEILILAKATTLTLDNKVELNAIADKVKASFDGFNKKYDGKAFSAIDKLLPKKSDYKGKAQLGG